MALRRATPQQFTPYGVTDALDSTNVRQGSMAMLTNLIPDPTTANLWQCRPASLELASMNAGGGPFSSGFSSGFQTGALYGGTQSFVSTLLVVGVFAYGMVATTAFGGGTDAPFALNLLNNQFTPISGITNANTPASPPVTGDWTPPTMVLVGSKVIVAHPGFNFGAGQAFGVLDITTPSAPAWSATNTTINPLVYKAQWVDNLNGRAYFLVNPPNAQPAAYFSDVLVPTQITNANQIITFDDSEALVATGRLGLYNQSGGVIQALMVFKGTANIYQITGDSALSTLSKNSLNVATGTQSPLSVTETPRGLAFMAPDGLRIIDFTARISDPIGVDGDGINAPFLYAISPTRLQAASNQNVLRISLQNGLAAGAPNQEYWYDISRHKWSGPHSFPASMIAAYNNTFIMTPLGVNNGTIWRSDVAQQSNSTFTENGVPMTWAYTTSLMPDLKVMSECAMVETTLDMQLTAGQQVTVQALTQQQQQIGSVLVTPPGGLTLWGQFNWGQQVWGGPAVALSHWPLPWTAPLVFSRMQLQASGASTGGFKIGDAFLRYQILGYIQRYVGATP